ncbi:hypothetical protein D8674_007804 [Pyrus ussuriensis x Pyrus communis]|uniref:Uncharacterized protein n=1 Tax=Pyrus ussuriensis x Pyrus communis TaxID=2448454 RepID=A0A5N5HR07_9ROSA|nr:hypothetical protein D8674_007804 [Pyrus ussuriensis x Pyrus communis]
MGNYEVTVHGYKVEVSVVTDVRLIAGKISELMTFQETRRVMGLDFKFDLYNETSNSCFFVLEIAAWLSQRLTVTVAPYVIRFNRHSLVFKVGVGVGFGHLAARVLKKPKLAWCCKVEELEAIKHAVHDIYATCLIGDKLLGML